MNNFRDSDEEPLTANEYRSGYSNDDEYRSSDHDKKNNSRNKNASYVIPSKMEQVQKEIETAKSLVRQGIVKVVDRGDKLEEINVKAEELQVQAGMFKKHAKKTRVQLSI